MSDGRGVDWKMRLTVVRGPQESNESSNWQSFELPDLGGASVSNVLQYINRHIDGSVAYYLSCRRGLCACCVVRIDGKIEKACVVPARDGMVLEPVKQSLLIKDTVVHLGMPRTSEYPLLDAAQHLQPSGKPGSSETEDREKTCE